MDSERNIRECGKEIMEFKKTDDGNEHESLYEIRITVSKNGYMLYDPSNNKKMKTKFKKLMHEAMLVTMNDNLLMAYQEVDAFKIKYSQATLK